MIRPNFAADANWKAMRKACSQLLSKENVRCLSEYQRAETRQLVWELCHRPEVSSHCLISGRGESDDSPELVPSPQAVHPFLPPWCSLWKPWPDSYNPCRQGLLIRPPKGHTYTGSRNFNPRGHLSLLGVGSRAVGQMEAYRYGDQGPG